MIAPIVTSPVSNILTWSSSLAITLEGTADNGSALVKINGSSSGVSYDPHTTIWSYSTTLNTYGPYTFNIFSEDISGNPSDSVDFTLTFEGPLLAQTNFNQLTVDLLGKVNSVSSIVESSASSATGFSSANITYTAHSNDFTFSNFTFTQPLELIYFRAGDTSSGYSDVTFENLTYTLNAPEIDPIVQPLTSVTVALSGSADLETSSFAYSPVGGVFTSGAVGSHMHWSYNFNLLQATENFSVASIDTFGNSSPSGNLSLEYILPGPVVTLPSYTESSNITHVISGTCHINSQDMLYSNSDIFNQTRVISTNDEFYTISSGYNTLNFKIDSISKSITLVSGYSLTAQFIVDQINYAFEKNVASSENGRIQLIGAKIEILAGSANTTLGFFVGNYNLTQEFGITQEPIIFTGRNVLDLTLNSVAYSITFSKDSSYTLDEVVNLINITLDPTGVKKYAFKGDQLFILTAESNLTVKTIFPELGILDKINLGYCTYTLGQATWSLNYTSDSSDITLYFIALDQFYSFTQIASKNLVYTSLPVAATDPRQKIKLTSDLCTSGTINTFTSSSAKFITDGVLLNHYVQAISGKNQGQIKQILGDPKVTETTITTEDFLNAFEPNDKIEIITNLDYTYNKLTLPTGGGSCDSSSNRIIYSTLNSNLVKVYSSNSTNLFNITPQTNTLKLSVNGNTQQIYFTVSESTASEIVSQINSFFDFTVAFLDSDLVSFYLLGNNIKILTQNTVLGFNIGDHAVCYEMILPDSILLETDLLFYVKIDDKDIKYDIKKKVSISKSDLILELNKLSTNQIAFSTPTGITLLGSSSFKVNFESEVLNITPGVVCLANFTSGLNVFDFIHTLQSNLTALNVWSLDYFYQPTEKQTLNLIYKIDKPTLASTYVLTTNVPQIVVGGTYDLEGTKVYVNNAEAVYSSGGVWRNDLTNLNFGDNSVTSKLQDIFGGFSEDLTFTVTYSDPTLVEYPPEPATLEWKSLVIQGLAPDVIMSVLGAVQTIGDYVIPLLKVISTVLGIVKAFLSDFSLLTIIRLLIGQILKPITDFLKSFMQGAGIYILSTIPTFADMKGLDKNLLSFVDGGFSGFKDKIISSFDDLNDPRRPQFHGSASMAGGYVLAMDSSNGIANFITSLDSFTRVFTNQALSVLNQVNNPRAEGKNKKVILHWERCGGMIPAEYRVYRAESPGGNPVKLLTKPQITKPGFEDTYISEDYIDPKAKVSDRYKYLGKIKSSPGITDYCFIDGNPTGVESNLLAFWDTLVVGIANDPLKFLLNPLQFCNDILKSTSETTLALTELLLVGYGNNNEELVNNKTYYYKIVPAIVDTNKELIGDGLELSATPQDPDLEEITDDLTDQMMVKDKDGKALTYVLSGSVYNLEYRGTSNDLADIVVTVDGGVVQPKNIVNANILNLNYQNEPSTFIRAKYWTKKQKSTTRAKIVGTVIPETSGNDMDTNGTWFKFTPTSNNLMLRVGKAINIHESVTDFAGISMEPLSTTQAVTFIKDFPIDPETDQIVPGYLTMDQVVSKILAQVSGVRVYADRKNRIVIEDDLNPDLYSGSYLKIEEGNSALGFITGAVSSPGSTTGIPPNWYSVRVMDFLPFLSDALNYANDVVQQFMSGMQSATNALSNFIGMLQDKVDSIIAMMEAIKNLIDSIVKMLSFDCGLYILTIPWNNGGNDYVKNAISTAKGAPASSDYTAGMVFLAADGFTAAILKLIFG